MSRSPNRLLPAPPDLVIIGAAEGPRRDSLVATAVRETGRAPVCLTWRDVVDNPDGLTPWLHDRAGIRFDSPDRDRASLAALYRAGRGIAWAGGYQTVEDFEALDTGDIGSPAQLATGLATAVAAVEARATGSGAVLSTTALDLDHAFDKTTCSQRLAGAGIAVPPVLSPIHGFDSLAAAMAETGLNRVFVKLRHGAAAAGIIALVRDGQAWRATTTAVLGPDGRVRATPDVQRINDRDAIARLVDRLAPLGLHGEAWLPKLGIGGLVSDLRLVVVGGEAIFPVLRRSRHPMTNLHIGGRRGPVDALVARIGAEAWAQVCDTARRTAACFGATHSVGIDMAVLNDGRRHAVLEVNVFGDHIRDFAVNGVTPHQAVVRHMLDRLGRGAVAA